MYISLKYLVLYIGSGAATGWVSKGDRKICLIGLGISALIGAWFSLTYAVISALEFAAGLALASLIRGKIVDPNKIRLK
jgi:hypothetical protein